MNETANATLALGALPVMAHAREEVEEMAAIAGALVLNIGTLSPHWVEAMLLAGRVANERADAGRARPGRRRRDDVPHGDGEAAARRARRDRAARQRRRDRDPRRAGADRIEHERRPALVRDPTGEEHRLDPVRRERADVQDERRRSRPSPPPPRARAPSPEADQARASHSPSRS